MPARQSPNPSQPREAELGQTGNPSPADGLQLFVTDLMKAGVGKDEVTKMGREVTGGLLMG